MHPTARAIKDGRVSVKQYGDSLRYVKEQTVPEIHCDRCYETAKKTARLIIKWLDKQGCGCEKCIEKLKQECKLDRGGKEE